MKIIWQVTCYTVGYTAVITYVDSTVTAQDLDFACDDPTPLIDLDESLQSQVAQV